MSTLLPAWLELSGCKAHDLALPDLAVRPGEVLVLLGPSGSGKTTLLMVLAGLLDPQAGQVRASLGSSNRRCLVPQQGALVHALNGLDNVLLAQHLAGCRRDVEQARFFLDKLGVGPCASLKPAQCSRGQQQRIAVARALVQQPSLLLLDEPTANLDDDSTAALLLELTHWIASPQRAMVLATHDARVMTHLRTALAPVQVVRMDGPPMEA